MGGQWGSIRDLTFGGGDPAPSGWIGGVLAGYNWNVGSGGVLSNTDVRFVGNLRARLGWAADRILLFVAGGGVDFAVSPNLILRAE